MEKSRRVPDESRILAHLDGTEESFLEIAVDADGSIQLYEAYSHDGGDRLAQKLEKLGVKLTRITSSPCG